MLMPTPTKHVYIADARTKLDDIIGYWVDDVPEPYWRDGLMVRCMRDGIELEVRGSEHLSRDLKRELREIAKAGKVRTSVGRSRKGVTAAKGFKLRLV
jgi:hypothetical protein